MLVSAHHISPEKERAYRACLFAHELELIGNLRRFPLISRARLDALELVMPLPAWQAFAYPMREALVLDAFDSEGEREALRLRIQQEARRALGAPLQSAPPKAMADYRNKEVVPASIARALLAFEVELTCARWAALSELARFSLAKLSRDGHDNRRLGPLVDDLFFAHLKDAPGP